jgi:hypothetical protein
MLIGSSQLWKPTIAEVCGLDPSQEYRICNALYGLPDCSRLFYLHYKAVISHVLRKMQFRYGISAYRVLHRTNYIDFIYSFFHASKIVFNYQ